jgi:adenylate kinase
MNQKSFIFIGRSGCGKGTQAKLLSDYLKKNDTNRKVLYIQPGEEFRNFIKGDSNTQKLSRDIYEVGGLQPEFLAIYMWTKVLVESYTDNEHIIIDGTPRKYHEAGVLDSIFSFYKINRPIVINIDITKEVSTSRLLARHRNDDTKKDISEKQVWYETDVVPTISFYDKNEKYQFIKIDGNRSIEEIHADIVSKI